MYVAEPSDYALPPEMRVDRQTAVEKEKRDLSEELHRDFPGITPKIIEAQGDVWTTIATAVEKYEIDGLGDGLSGEY